MKNAEFRKRTHSAFLILHSELPYRSHPAYFRQKRNRRIPSMRPINQECLANEEIALDVVMFAPHSVPVFGEPISAVGALRAVVAQRQELVFVKREPDAAAIALAEQPGLGAPLRRTAEDFAN